MTRIVFLNGPPRSGKDTAARLIMNAFHGVQRLGFADHLKRATHAAYGMFDIPFDHFEAVKDDPREEFFGLAPRRAYIEHSETYMKPLHGPLVFGHLWLRDARQRNASAICVPDSGFAPEAGPGIEHFGAENCTLIRLHRPGHDFGNDSRSYVELPVRTFDIANDDDTGRLRARLMEVLAA
jgi:hypothetical protein